MLPVELIHTNLFQVLHFGLALAARGFLDPEENQDSHHDSQGTGNVKQIAPAQRAAKQGSHHHADQIAERLGQLHQPVHLAAHGRAEVVAHQAEHARVARVINAGG